MNFLVRKVYWLLLTAFFRIAGGTRAFALPVNLRWTVSVNGQPLQDGGDSDVDYLIFQTTYGVCEGAPNYLSAADLDGDGCVSVNDCRILRSLM